MHPFTPSYPTICANFVVYYPKKTNSTSKQLQIYGITVANHTHRGVGGSTVCRQFFNWMHPFTISYSTTCANFVLFFVKFKATADL